MRGKGRDFWGLRGAVLLDTVILPPPPEAGLLSLLTLESSNKPRPYYSLLRDETSDAYTTSDWGPVKVLEPTGGTCFFERPAGEVQWAGPKGEGPQTLGSPLPTSWGSGSKLEKVSLAMFSLVVSG